MVFFLNVVPLATGLPTPNHYLAAAVSLLEADWSIRVWGNYELLLSPRQPFSSSIAPALQPQTQWICLHNLHQIAALSFLMCLIFSLKWLGKKPCEWFSKSSSPTSCELPLITHPLDSLNLICDKRRCVTFPLQLRLCPKTVQRTNTFESGPSCRPGSLHSQGETESWWVLGSPGLCAAGSWASVLTRTQDL